MFYRFICKPPHEHPQTVPESSRPSGLLYPITLEEQKSCACNTGPVLYLNSSRHESFFNALGFLPSCKSQCNCRSPAPMEETQQEQNWEGRWQDPYNPSVMEASRGHLVLDPTRRHAVLANLSGRSLHSSPGQLVSCPVLLAPFCSAV